MADAREGLCLCWLSCCESLTYKARERLKMAYPSAQAVFDGFSDALLPLVGEKAWGELSKLREKGLEKLEQALNKHDIRFTALTDEDFPVLLEGIVDPPDLLFYRGTIRKEEGMAVAVVGSRRETRYGREQAFQIARDLAAQGVTIVSGLARGIDTAAHRGALQAHGRTVSVLGSGIMRVYPDENQDLAEEIIASGGAVISEFAPHAQPLAFRFPFRNRLVSGLSNGVLLIEAREKSGTLITVGHALTQGRDVFALPGQVDAPGSAIPHQLLREGARLATCASDIMDDMGWRREATAEQIKMPLPDLTNDQRRLYDALCDEPRAFNDLIAAMGLSAQDLNVLVTTLEMDGVIEALPGRMFRRAR